MRRITPLNILTAVLVTAVSYLLVFHDKKEGGGTWGWIPLMGIGVIAVAADLIFRSFLKDLQRIWIVELSFIIFAAVAIILIKQL